MGVRLLVGEYEGRSTTGQTVMIDSVTEWAFGPLFWSRSEAEDFLRWCKDDPRSLSSAELEDRHREWAEGRG